MEQVLIISLGDRINLIIQIIATSDHFCTHLCARYVWLPNDIKHSKQTYQSLSIYVYLIVWLYAYVGSDAFAYDATVKETPLSV